MRSFASLLFLSTVLAVTGACAGDAGRGDGAATDDEIEYPKPVEIPTGITPSQPMPDLTVNVPLLEASPRIRYMDDSHEDYYCAMVEGCFSEAPDGPWGRTLLQFSVGVANIGTADLELGDPAAAPEGTYEYSDCHGHYHYSGFAEYALKTNQGVTATGHKQAYCLMDVEDYGAPGPELPEGEQPFTCDYQGVHAGYQDVYDRDLPCQWIDVTGLDSGTYTLEVTVNANHQIPEAGPGPNTVAIPIDVQLD